MSSCCGGCKMYPDMSYAENSSSETLVMGVAAPETTEKMEGGEVGFAGAENGCKCGSNCTCDPCTCDTEITEKMEGGEMGGAGEENGCKCDPCTCDPCTCK